MRGRWKLIGIDFHLRWRGGLTRLDINGDSLLAHHGFYSLEWARGEFTEYFRGVRRAFKAPGATPRSARMNER